MPLQGAEPDGWELGSEHCPSGLHNQQSGPFAVLLFCEDALGAYLAVVHVGPLGAPTTQNERWTLNDRYWYEPIWGSDVTGFQWSNDKKTLLVSTQQIYGAGGYFELDLETRSATQRLPIGELVSIEKPGPGYDIKGSPLSPIAR